MNFDFIGIRNMIFFGKRKNTKLLIIILLYNMYRSSAVRKTALSYTRGGEGVHDHYTEPYTYEIRFSPHKNVQHRCCSQRLFRS